MISLYPFHIHISFPYSHILPYPYISHVPVSVFLSVPPVALPLVFFFIFHFCGMKAGCVFLVVFRCRYCERFSSRLSFRSSTRFSRFVFRLVPRFAPRPVLPVPPFALLFCLFCVSFCSFGRIVRAICGARRFVLLFGVGDWVFALSRSSVSWRGVGR